MAVSWVILGTHDGHPQPLRPIQQSLNSILKLLGSGHLPIQGMTVGIVKMFSLGPPTQALPKKHIGNSGRRQSVLKIPTIELRVVLRPRGRSNIGYGIHLVALQQSDEAIGGMSRVPNTQQVKLVGSAR